MSKRAAVAKRLFNIAAICSAVACLAFAAACLLAASVDPVTRFLTLHQNLHLSIDQRPYGPALEVFNDANYGPYRGSIISVSAPGLPSEVKSTGLDFVGVYYRDFRWPNGMTLWTLSLSLIYLVVLGAVLPATWVIRRLRRSRRAVEDHPAAVEQHLAREQGPR